MNEYYISNLFNSSAAIAFIERYVQNTSESRHIAVRHKIWFYISQNPAAIHIIEKNLDIVDWTALCSNPSHEAGVILSKNLNKIDWKNSRFSDTPENIKILRRRFEDNKLKSYNLDLIVRSKNMSVEAVRLFQDAFDLLDKYNILSLCKNIRAVEIFKGREDKIFWRELSESPYALPLLRENLDKVCWTRLSKNGAATPLLRENIDKVNWRFHSQFAEDISLLEENINKVDWDCLSMNPFALTLLERNEDKVNWTNLSENCNAIDILKRNMDKISWYDLCRNDNSESISLILDHIQEKDIEFDVINGNIDWSSLILREDFPCHIIRDKMERMTKNQFKNSEMFYKLCHSKNPEMFEDPLVAFLK
jgi:hypothetical protein